MVKSKVKVLDPLKRQIDRDAISETRSIDVHSIVDEPIGLRYDYHNHSVYV